MQLADPDVLKLHLLAEPGHPQVPAVPSEKVGGAWRGVAAGGLHTAGAGQGSGEESPKQKGPGGVRDL